MVSRMETRLKTLGGQLEWFSHRDPTSSSYRDIRYASPALCIFVTPDENMGLTVDPTCRSGL